MKASRLVEEGYREGDPSLTKREKIQDVKNYGEKTKNQADHTCLKLRVSGKVQSSGPDAGSASFV
jgi:hypothetical protein